MTFQKRSQQVITSSLTESDIGQKSDLVSHISFSEFAENLRQSCRFLSNQEGIQDCSSNPSTYHSTYESLLLEGLPIFNQKIPFFSNSLLKFIMIMWLIT